MATFSSFDTFLDEYSLGHYHLDISVVNEYKNSVTDVLPKNDTFCPKYLFLVVKYFHDSGHLKISHGFMFNISRNYTNVSG